MMQANLNLNAAVMPIELLTTQGQIITQAGHQVLITKSETQNINHITANEVIQSNIQQQTVENENDKRDIYRHPLFPLMALLLEKCELAAATADAAGSDGFCVDIQSFVQQQEQEKRPFLTDDAELDNLMLKAIQVLRIHLLELEKVTDLCQDFCHRYISCLKGKLQSDTLLRVENVYDDADDHMNMQISPPSQSSINNMATNVNQGQLVSGGTVYQMVQTPQGIVAQPIQLQTAVPQQQTQSPVQHQQPQQHSQPLQHQQQQQVTSPTVIHGSTPLSKIGVPSVTPPPPNTNHNALSSVLNMDDDDNSQSTKRGVLPKQATAVMKSWLFQHIIHPYPTEDEKRQIAQQTNLSLLQVNNWFINARRRILQPMLDSSDPGAMKCKKNKPQQARPMQRFWPESIASIQPQTSFPLHQLTDNESAAAVTSPINTSNPYPVGAPFPSYQTAPQLLHSPQRASTNGSPMA